MKSSRPGELIQFDYMTVDISGYGQIKHFSAIYPTTKIAIEKIYKGANSRNEADFLKRVIAELPFTVIFIQVDGGSKFMKNFENLCQKLNISLYVLSPISSKYNGNVERGMEPLSISCILK